MLVSLLLTDNDTINVTYKTDLEKNATVGNFTILDILDCNDTEKHLGLDFKQIDTNLQAFKDFAEENSLALVRIDDDGKEILANHTVESSSSILDELF